MSTNLWILTEERPKSDVIETIVRKFAFDRGIALLIDTVRVVPILDQQSIFVFKYLVIGIHTPAIEQIYIKTVSGNSSFVDYLVFYQSDEPTPQHTPLYAIEETKTDDKESRNTGVYQRCSKFVYIRPFFPTTRLIMLYSLRVSQKSKPTATYIFGTRLLMTIGVEIIGKDLSDSRFVPFASIDELIDYKNNMHDPPSGNIPIHINKQEDDLITISGRLFKSGRLAHDPNIGAISIIAYCLRQLGWSGRIVVTQHGLNQNCIGQPNKFVQIANIIGLQLQNLTIPNVNLPQTYWHYECEGEKLGTILIHIAVESFTTGYSIFENHAGCEKGYFIKSNGTPIPLEKYVNRDRYKAGDHTAIYAIPDLILLDPENLTIIDIEGKKYCNVNNGINELQNYTDIERDYIQKDYPHFKIVRTVVLYGSNETTIKQVEVGFLLNRHGDMILGIVPPALFSEAITNLRDYWNTSE